MQIIRNKTEAGVIENAFGGVGVDEIIVEEIVIDSIIDKIAGGEAAHDNTAGEGVAVRDKTAGESEAIRDKIAEGGETADDNTIDPSVELAILEAAELAVDPFVGLVVLEAADRVDEEADKNIVEEIVSNSSTEAIIDKKSRETNRQRS